ARRIVFLERGWLWCRRKPVLAGLAAGVVVLLLLVGIVIMVSVHKTGEFAGAADQAKAHSAQLQVELSPAEKDKAKEQEEKKHKEEMAEHQKQDHEAHLAYVANMQEVYDSLEKDDTARARLLLDRHLPTPDKKDNRCWEWYFLNNRLAQAPL